MKKRSRLMPFPIILLILASLACSIQANLGEDETEAAPENIGDVSTETPESAPPAEGSGVATEPPGAALSNSPTVTGILVDTSAGDFLSVYDTNFTLMAEIPTPGGSDFQQGDAVAISSWDGGPIPPAIAFRSFANGGEVDINQDFSPSLLSLADGLMNLAAAPGLPYLAYARVLWGSDPATSRLYFGHYSSLESEGGLIQEYVDPNGWAMTPLMVMADEDTPRGVWYTMGAWGIGGDIVFRPVRALRYYDALSGAVTEILNENQRPAGISWDGTWIAYSEGSYTDMTGLTLRNMTSSFSVTLPVLLTSDRGAGDAFFSPDGLHVAWLEGSGWMMAEVPNYHGTVRIAGTVGTLLADIPDSAVHDVVSDTSITWVEPVGWLSDTLLLIQVRGNNAMSAYLVTYDIPTGELTYVLNGNFVSLVYQ